MKKKIILLDDEPLIPILMKEIIEEDTALVIAKITSTREEFLDFVGQHTLDAALVDISMGGHREGGIDLLKEMRAKRIDLPLIIVSAHDELHYALRCLKAGARGYINKKYICSDIATCLNKVLEGDLYVSGNKADHILKQYQEEVLVS